MSKETVKGAKATQPVPCPTCKAPIFVRENGTIVSHYDGDGNRCATNEKLMPCDCWKHYHQVCDVCQGISRLKDTSEAPFDLKTADAEVAYRAGMLVDKPIVPENPKSDKHHIAMNTSTCPVCRKPMHPEYGENGQDIWCHENGEAEIECEQLRNPVAASTIDTRGEEAGKELAICKLPDMYSRAHQPCVNCGKLGHVHLSMLAPVHDDTGDIYCYEKVAPPQTVQRQGEPYTYQALYEKRAKELANLIVSGHAQSIDKVARLLAKEDAGR